MDVCPQNNPIRSSRPMKSGEPRRAVAFEDGGLGPKLFIVDAPALECASDQPVVGPRAEQQVRAEADRGDLQADERCLAAVDETQERWRHAPADHQGARLEAGEELRRRERLKIGQCGPCPAMQSHGSDSVFIMAATSSLPPSQDAATLHGMLRRVADRPMDLYRKRRFEGCDCSALSGQRKKSSANTTSPKRLAMVMGIP
jgi:hypothetical protein